MQYLVIAKLVNLQNIQTIFSAKSLIRHEIKTIEGRRAFARLTSSLLGLMECLAKQDLRRNIV
jgi:hypothetical protein